MAYLRMQTDKQAACFAVSCVERGNIQILKKPLVILRVISERRCIQDQLFIPALRVQHKKIFTQGVFVTGLEKVICSRCAERQNLILSDPESFCIQRCNIGRRTYNICKLFCAFELTPPDIFRLRNMKSELFENTFSVPKLGHNRIFAEVKHAHRHEVVV